jgi:Glyoxalase-like domain
MALAIPLRDVSPQTWRRLSGRRLFVAARAQGWRGKRSRNSIPVGKQGCRAMAATLPMPTLDHVVVNVRDRIDAGLETYQRLGFTMTPRGYHTLGSMNHLAILGTEYLELIAAQPGDTRRAEILASPFGLNGLVFGTDDSAAVYAALNKNGVPIEPPLEFSRPVELADGPHDATFRTVRLKQGTVPSGRIYFCHHFTRNLVWRDEWRHHANGAIGVARAVIAARDPAALGGLFSQMFGEDAVQQDAAGFTLAVGLSRFDVLPPDELMRQFGDTAPDAEGRTQFMAALTIRTRSLKAAAAALEAGRIAGVRREADRLIVPATQAFGVTLEFRI